MNMIWDREMERGEAEYQDFIEWCHEFDYDPETTDIEEYREWQGARMLDYQEARAEEYAEAMRYGY